MLDWVVTLHVPKERSVIDENWHDVLIMYSRDQSGDIKWVLIKSLYLLNYVSDLVERFHLFASTKESVIHKNDDDADDVIA